MFSLAAVLCSYCASLVRKFKCPRVYVPFVTLFTYTQIKWYIIFVKNKEKGGLRILKSILPLSVCVCVHVNNPSLTVSRVVSLTVPKTAPVGSNPFEDDDDEEEEDEEEAPVEQQTSVNHNSVNKEEIKTLVNRR